jgi:branched-chain amino acid aminotransferase
VLVATHLITPPLNGQILPGVTRDSLLTLARAHAAGSIALAGLPPSNLVVEEREFTLADLEAWSASGSLLECFGAGTAAVLQPISRIGIPDAEGNVVDIHISVGEAGIGPIAESLHQRMSAIQTGTVEGPAGWKVLCH